MDCSIVAIVSDMVRDSRVGLTEIPGIGFDGKRTFYEVLRRLHP
ncbi:MAG: hypothetical protein QOK35_853 [Pseudonocardiales bacterium]|jgi:transposase|nr:hypothetical protein [Pseudonocardiales bacterium]